MMQEMFLGACLLSWMDGGDFLSHDIESTLLLFQLPPIDADPSRFQRRQAHPQVRTTPAIGSEPVSAMSLSPSIAGRRERHRKEALDRLLVAAQEIMAEPGLENAR